MRKKKDKKDCLRAELEHYQAQGIGLWLNGRKSSPKEIARAYKISEKGTYMRDYVQDEHGRIENLSFDLIRDK